MKCPECVEQGLRSKVYSHGGISTLMAFTPYYDEDGLFHNHDGNKVTDSYSCSNGHNFVKQRKRSCPNCDWTNGE